MWLSTIIACAIRLGVPLLLAALGVLISARSGIVNMGMEGNMLFGAFIAVYVTDAFGIPLLGVMAGIVAGIIYSLLMGFFIIMGRGNHVVIGLGFNFIAIGATTVLTSSIWGQTGYSPAVKRLTQVELPFLGQQSINLFVAIFITFGVWFFLSKMTLGRRVSMVGENPAAADSVGIDVVKYRFLAMFLAGALGGLGGAELSVGQIGYFLKQMTASKGFLAYSAVIFAGYQPIPTVITTMVLGLFEAIQIRAQSMYDIPGQFMLMLPYLVTLFALFRTDDKKRPRSAGQIYVRGNS